MTATEFIRTTLEASKNWVQTLVQNSPGNELTFPTPKGGNHPLWVMGHLAYAEAGFVSRFIFGEQNPLENWTPLFGMGSHPVADASKYPKLAELIAEWDKVRARTLQVLASLSDADLDRPSKAPPERQAMFGTIGKVLALLCNHQSFHVGQVADARRAAGLKPILG